VQLYSLEKLAVADRSDEVRRRTREN